MNYSKAAVTFYDEYGKPDMNSQVKIVRPEVVTLDAKGMEVVIKSMGYEPNQTAIEVGTMDLKRKFDRV